MEENTINQKAGQLLDEAAFTSSLVKKKEREKGTVKEDHMYPASKEETDRMADLLRQAKDAADDPNEPTFSEKYNQLDGIVQWSYGRYRTWQWSLIAGAVLCALLLLWTRSSNQKDTERHKAELAQVEAWMPCDTTLVWEKIPEEGGIAYDARLYNANNYKAYTLTELKHRVLSNEKWAKEYQQKADTATTQERKESFLKSAQHDLDNVKKYRAEFDSIAPMKYDQIKSMAIDDCKNAVKNSKSTSGTYLGFCIFLAILIALYIWTGYAYGYEMTRTRTRDKILGWVRKAGFWLAGIFFGAGLAMQLFAPDYIVKTTYANGSTSTHRESDIGGTAINAIFKIGLMVIGIFIFIFISLFIMLVETIGGLKNKIRTLTDTKKTTAAEA